MAKPAEDEPVAAPPADAEVDVAEEDEGSLVDRVKDLADDARTAVEAELAWQMARAGYAGRRVTTIAAWGGLALACAFVAVLAVAFGAILTLAPLIGPGSATAVVTAVLLVAAVVAALFARGGIRRLRGDLSPKSPGAGR